MIQLGWSDVLERFDEAMRLLNDMGLGALATKGRFGAYRRHMEQTLRVEGVHTVPVEHALMLCEVKELVLTLPFLRAASRNEVFPKLYIGLTGPDSVIDEGPTSNHARNAMFELTMAARLWRAGLSPKLADDADVRSLAGRCSLNVSG